MLPVLPLVRGVCILTVAIACASPVVAQDKKKGDVRPYEEVVTKDAASDPGVFLVHRIDDRILYEIPASELGHDFLWLVQIAGTQAGSGYGGTPAAERIVRFELRDDKVLLRDVRYSVRADTKDSIKNAIEAISIAPIIALFPVRAWGRDKAPVIDVTDLFKGDVTEFSARAAFNAQGADPSKSFIESVKSFPENIETKVLMTYRVNKGGFDFETGDWGPPQTALTALIHHSMVRLPLQPMKPRKYDSRVGFFTVGFLDYASQEQGVERVNYVNRWRLEKRDANAAVSEPIKPIVYYVGREVPDKWKPWVKKGVEMWQPVFEAAGFRNAIVAKDAPSPQEDPDWDAEDARFSSIRWMPSVVENAYGPHVHDPRTGEILEADIQIFHNVLKLARDWYFVQASPNDERAQSLPLPDELLGELLAYIVAHEVGHTLGFPHNMKASSAFTVEQLRSKEFTEKWGCEASIMDYGRFNYVAQPGDGARLIPKIGPYDFFAIEWGYREFAAGLTPDQEQAELNKIVSRQVTDPVLRFSDPNPFLDPSAQTEDLGSDGVAATELGLKNIDRVASYLVKATCKDGKNYDLLSNMYDALLGQRDMELNHVVAMVGGAVWSNLWYGQGDRQFEPVPAERQRAAVAFLLQHAFQVPQTLIAPEIVDRLQPNGAVDRFRNSQVNILRYLVNTLRLRRMAEFEARAPGASYGPAALLEDLRRGLMIELERERVAVDLYRRNTQRAWIDLLVDITAQNARDSDVSALARAELKVVQRQMSDALIKCADRVTEVHLTDLLDRCDRALDPRGKY